MNNVPHQSGGSTTAERKLPPVMWVGVLALALAISGVTYLSSSIPIQPPLPPAIALLAASAAAVMINAVTLARVRDFAWRPFFVVFRWTLAGYGLIAGLMMFVFIFNKLPSTQLVLLIATLIIGAVDIPMILAFSVARYQQPEGGAAEVGNRSRGAEMDR